MSSEASYDSGVESDPEMSDLLRAVAHAPPLARPPKVGDVVGDRYRLDSTIGQGGMGRVFAAFDLRTEKEVALKWMTSSAIFGGERERTVALARFLREARIAARVDHPNVVDVYDVCVEVGSPYFVMERLYGRTLRSRIAQGPLGWDEALEVIVPACRGVAALHRAGIVHRDLKPDNIFLCDATGERQATTKVLDFGVSRASAADTSTLTRTGAILGTPAYMPLEQLRGAAGITPSADVYSLGVVLYESLTGVRPFDSHGVADQAVLLATSNPRPLEDHVPSLSRARIAVVMKAIGREAATRFDSVEAFVDALLAADARVARSPWPYAVAALALLALAGIGVTARRDRDEPSSVATAPARSHDPARSVEVDGVASSAPPPTLEPIDLPTPESLASHASPASASRPRPRPLDEATPIRPDAAVSPGRAPDLESATTLDPTDF